MVGVTGVTGQRFSKEKLQTKERDLCLVRSLSANKTKRWLK
jgi:hypothetical protein